MAIVAKQQPEATQQQPAALPTGDQTPLTLREVCAELHCTRNFLLTERKAKRLRFLKLGPKKIIVTRQQRRPRYETA
ncbi:MAG: hypothetical protein LBC63_09810 [Holophagales bacterium]|jgi:hypothetical protein|nr:hypothetical protein [Holophagales bacterium]